MDFLKKLATESTGDNTATTAPTPTPTEKKDSSNEHHQASQAEVLASAKVVTEAARATFQGEKNKVDSSKVAGAGADFLDAAERYGKMDTTTGVGSYVEKAEDYLHKYESSHPTTAPSKEPEKKTTPSEHPAAKHEGESGDSGGGYGDMMKMGADFLKKN